MVKYYILIKRKTSKKWVGAIPSKKNVSLTKLKTIIKNSIKKGWTAKIITQTQLKKFLLKKTKKPIKRKKVVRKKRK